jgi:hypothetical protein
MWVVSFMSRLLYPFPGKSPWYTLHMRLGGPQNQSVRRGEENKSCSYRNWNSDPSAVEPAASRDPPPRNDSKLKTCNCFKKDYLTTRQRRAWRNRASSWHEISPRDTWSWIMHSEAVKVSHLAVSIATLIMCRSRLRSLSLWFWDLNRFPVNAVSNAATFAESISLLGCPTQ